jgi:hypothetical protein
MIKLQFEWNRPVRPLSLRVSNLGKRFASALDQSQARAYRQQQRLLALIPHAPHLMSTTVIFHYNKKAWVSNPAQCIASRSIVATDRPRLHTRRLRFLLPLARMPHPHLRPAFYRIELSLPQ